MLQQSFFCADGSANGPPSCAYRWESGQCVVAESIEQLCKALWPLAPPSYQCPLQGSTDSSDACAHLGSAEIPGNGADDNDDGCIDEGTMLGSGNCTCAARCDKPTCSPRARATCTPVTFGAEICGNRLDDNCNGFIDEGCAPKTCESKLGSCVNGPTSGAANAGNDPILLLSQSVATEPFTDFQVETLGALDFTRTYSSMDASFFGGETGPLGRGWHHNWEADLTCDGAQCRISRGLEKGFQFQPAELVTRLDGQEQWQIYRALSNAQVQDDHRNLLARRSTGEWILFLTDGQELHFQTVCDNPDGTGLVCLDPRAGGLARLTALVDARGNRTAVTYDRPNGLRLGITDPLGHTLQLRCTGDCDAGLATELRYDGVVVARYSYVGADLDRAVDADGNVLRSYVYDDGGMGLVIAVKNEAGAAVAEFSYDELGRAIGVIDRLSSVGVNYKDASTYEVTEYFGDRAVTAERKFDVDGHVLSVGEGSALGPAKTFTWTNRRLSCVLDSSLHVTRYQRDTLGRVWYEGRGAWSATAAGNACTSTGFSGASTERWRTYGVQKPIAQGLALDLDHQLTESRPNVFGRSERATETTSYDPAPQAIDPPGYACQAPPLPAGAVVCRTISAGFTRVPSGNGYTKDLAIRRATFFSYDARGRLVRTVGPISLDNPSPADVTPVEERTYWPDDDALARRGRLHEVKRYPSPTAAPLVTSYDYDMFGVFQVQAPNGGISTTLRDGRGRAILAIGPDGATTATRYHDGLDPRLVLTPAGGAIRYTYDLRGRVALVEHLDGDPEAPGANPTLADAEATTYDLAGNPIHVERRDAAGRVTWQRDRIFDVQHREVTDTHPELPDHQRTLQYDASGFLVSSTDEEGRTTIFSPDPLNRVTKVTKRLGTGTATTVAQYGLDKDGNPTVVIDASNSSTSYTYDDFGSLVDFYNANLSTSYYHAILVYGARGELLQRTQPGVPTESYTYDGLDRLLTKTVTSDGASTAVRYAYDEDGAVGQLTRVIESDRTTRYVYDLAGRLTAEEVTEAGVTSSVRTEYHYGADGMLTEVWYPSGLQLRYDRDRATGRVKDIVNLADGTRFARDIAYLPNGPVASFTFGNGLAFSETRNLRHEPRALASGPLRLTYTMSPAGDVFGIDDGSAARTFTYDALDRLTGAPGWLAYGIYPGGRRYSSNVAGAYSEYVYASPLEWLAGSTLLLNGAALARRHSFTHDRTGNVSGVGVFDAGGSRVVAGLCLVHDATHQVVTVGSASPSTFTWGGFACSSESGVTPLARFRYDASRRRVARQDASTGAWTQFVHGTDGALLSELARPATASGAWTPRRDYVWLDGFPIAQIEYRPGGASTYSIHADHLGLPRRLTNRAGDVVWSAEALPFGELTETTAPDPLTGQTVVTNLRLPGQYDERLLGPLGLQGPYYNWNRWYLPGVGRYLEPDPIALSGGFNTEFGVDWYGYADQNPMGRTDPTGLLSYAPCPANSSCEGCGELCTSDGCTVICPGKEPAPKPKPWIPWWPSPDHECKKDEGTCSCQHRDDQTSSGVSCQALREAGLCKGPYKGTGTDTASCQDDARQNAPAICRGCLKHCEFRPPK